AVLARRQPEREAPADPPVERRREGERDPRRARAKPAPPREQEGVDQELVEREPPPGPLRLLEVVGEVEGAERLVKRRGRRRGVLLAPVAHERGEQVARRAEPREGGP